MKKFKIFVRPAVTYGFLFILSSKIEKTSRIIAYCERNVKGKSEKIAKTIIVFVRFFLKSGEGLGRVAPKNAFLFVSFFFAPSSPKKKRPVSFVGSPAFRFKLLSFSLPPLGKASKIAIHSGKSFVLLHVRPKAPHTLDKPKKRCYTEPTTQFHKQVGKGKLSFYRVYYAHNMAKLNLEKTQIPLRHVVGFSLPC